MNTLYELLLKWRDGTLTQPELAALNAMLPRPEARTQLVQEFALDEDLCEAIRTQYARLAAQEQAEAYETLEVKQPHTPPERDAIRLVNVRRVWTALPWRIILPLVACLIIMTVLPVVVSSRITLGRLEETTSGVTLKRGPKILDAATPGLRIHLGDELNVPSNSTATIAYAREATRVRVQGAARLVLDKTPDGKRLELLAGALVANVAPQPQDQPMQIITPDAYATVLGTEFSLHVSPNGSRLEVVEGTVRLARRFDERSIVVSAGHCALANSGSEFAARRLLPEPWNSQDIGMTGRPGHARWEGKQCLVAGGANPRRGRDEFHFVYQTLEGDGEIRARVLDFESKDKRAKAGVVIRESLKSTAPTAFLRVKAGRGLEFTKNGRRGPDLTQSVGEEAFPYWVRLVRRGDTITAYKSPDGLVWTETGSGNFEMGPLIYVGLGVISFDKAALNTAVFDNVSVIAAQLEQP